MIETSAGQGADGSDMSKLESEFEQNKEKVVEMLIENVMTVNCSIPRVVRGKFGEDEE